MKDLAVISDPKTIKVLMEPTRSQILFKYLVNGSMTVKQLADALGKNPGTILHHIEKLKNAGLVVQERTEQTVTGIVQRYYRATAREYRLGLSELMRSDEGVAKFAENRLKSMIRALQVYGIRVEDDEIDQGVELLRELLDRENEVSGNVPIVDEEAYHKLPEAVKRDASRLIRKFLLEEDTRYKSLRDKWNKFLRSHMER